MACLSAALFAARLCLIYGLDFNGSRCSSDFRAVMATRFPTYLKLGSVIRSYVYFLSYAWLLWYKIRQPLQGESHLCNDSESLDGFMYLCLLF